MKGEMYLWRCAFAVILGLIWYFSEFGYFWVQVSCCALCFLTIYLTRGTSAVCESSTQTDSASEEATSQQKSETGQIVPRDEPDTAVRTVQKPSHQSHYPNVQRSIQHMFKCVYTHLILPWSTAPELGESQPLHAALLTEFNLVMDKIICNAKDMDLTVTALGCIQIFTQHLHNAKQSDGSPAFMSKAEEIALIRECSKALIHNLVPKHLWEPKVYYCVLQEILAVEALAIVALLSDPDNLNQLIISQLDQMPSENPMEELHDPDQENPPSYLSENKDVLQGESEEHPSEKGKAKKKGKQMKEKLSKLFDNIKPNKAKRKKKEAIEKAVSCRRPAVIEMGGSSCSEGSICDSVDTDVECLKGPLQEEMMEFKLSYEMWRVGNWAVTVTNVQVEGNELCFTVHLEDSNNPENLHWDVKKDQSDILKFYNECKERGHLDSLLAIVEKTEDEAREAGELLEHSLQELVKNPELGKSELLFKFLGPMDWILHEEEHDEGLWVLLGGIASFLNLGHDDEPCYFKGEEKQHEVRHECMAWDATPQHELDNNQPLCTDILQRQDMETDDNLLVADGGHIPTSEQTSTCTSETQQTDHTGYFFDQPEVNPEIQSAFVNIAQFASRMKYLKLEHNFKRQPAVFSSSTSDADSSIHCSTDTDSHYNENNISKEENLHHRKSSETDKPERNKKEEDSLSQPSGEKKNFWEQPEANKVIFDLLKEICGNSYIFKFLKTVVTPFTPLINKQLNAFLKKMNPSEAQIATYINSLCERIWPDRAVLQPPTQSNDNKNETKQKALQIMTSKFAGFAIINKTNVENIFKIFQNADENKKLVYMLLTYLLSEFLPAKPSFGLQSKLNVKPTN